MEPSAKRIKSKLDDGVLVMNKLKGRITFCIAGISEYLTEGFECISDPVRIRGFDWTLWAITVTNIDNGIEFFIKCNCGSWGSDWKCEASVIFFCTTGGEKVEIDRDDDIQFDETSTDDEWIRICTVKNNQVGILDFWVLVLYIQVRVHSPTGTITMDVVNDTITLVAHISVKDGPGVKK